MQLCISVHYFSGSFMLRWSVSR